MSVSTAPVALVTGAARRIGAAIARALHARGYVLALHVRTVDADADALCAEFNAARANSAWLVAADLADPNQAEPLIAACVAHFGRLDVLVNNASNFERSALGHTTAQDWEAAFAVNARAPWFLSQAAAPYLTRQGGAIVNLVDVYAERPPVERGLYVMAKAALQAMTRALAVELAPAVRVNAVAPGAILWPGTQPDEAAQAYRQGILDRTPLQRTGDAAEIAHAVAWLACDATFTTGEVVRVDGGRMLPP